MRVILGDTNMLFDVTLSILVVLGLVVMWFNPSLAAVFLSAPAGAFLGQTLAKLHFGEYKKD